MNIDQPNETEPVDSSSSIKDSVPVGAMAQPALVPPGSVLSGGRLALFALAAVLGLGGFIFARNLIDFPVYYAAGKSLLSGRTDLYSADFARGAVMDYRYPPLFLLMFAPLSLLPYKAAALLWHLINVAAICLSVVVLDKLVVAGSGKRVGVWMAAFFVVAPYYVMILHYGNAHLLATALVFAGLYLATIRREFGAATLFAFAVTIKITPLLILPYFAVKRRFRFLGLVLILTAILNFAPSVYFGIGRNAELLGEWYNHVVVDQEFHEANGPINLSLKGMLRRYLTEVDYSKRIDGDTRYDAVNLMNLPVDRVDRLWIGISSVIFAAVLGLIAWSTARLAEDDPGGARRTNRKGFTTTEGLELGLILCLTLLVGPLTSKIYFVALLWPVVCVASSRANRRFIRIALLTIAVLSSGLPLLPGRGLQRLFLVLGVDFYLNCSLLVLMVIALVLACRSKLRSASRQLPVQPSAKTP